MKKILLSGLLFLGLNANSQIVTGSVAADFTLTDIDGVTHNLYDYLDAGKTVIIDVSATWCGPCWAYHNTGALETLWTEHGPVGGTNVSNTTTDDVIILFIEGETTNTLAQLQGPNATQSYAANSQGDWITGVSHPIIDLTSQDAPSFFSNYDITGFPSIIKICPNRLMEDIGQATAAQAYASKQLCPAAATADVDVLYNSYLSAPVVCQGSSYTPKVKFMNNSSTTLTNATITVTSGGNTVSTGTYSGSLAKYGLTTVTCSPITNFSGGNLTCTITASGDINPLNNVSVQNVVLSSATMPGSSAIVKPICDHWGSETTWAIKDLNGNVKTSGGPYADGTADATYPQTNKTVTLTTGCYYLEVNDSYGDGFTGTSGNGSISVTVNGVTFAAITDFTTSYKAVGFYVDNALSLAGLDNLKDVVGMSIYPNPASDKINVVFNAENLDYTINISDITGRILSTNNYSQLADAQNIELPLTGISTGNYIVSISSDKGTVNQHFIVK